MNDQQRYAIDHPHLTRDVPPDSQAFTRQYPAGRFGLFAVTVTVEADAATIREWHRPCWHASCAAYFKGRPEALALDSMPLEMRQFMWRLLREALVGVGDDRPETPPDGAPPVERFGFQRQRWKDAVHGRRALSREELGRVAQLSTA